METSAEVMEACVCSSRDGVPRAFRTSARLSAGRKRHGGRTRRFWKGNCSGGPGADRNIPVKCPAQKQAVEQREQIHACPERPGIWNGKKSEHEAGKIDGPDVVAECEHQRRFPARQPAVLQAFRRHTGAHGEAAEKADDEHVKAGIGQAEERPEQRSEQAGKAVGEIHADQDSGKNHKGQKGWNHFFKPQIQPRKGQRQRFFILQKHGKGESGEKA